ncbi:MAG TPA: VCBS repeat-containing protein [Candidatus Thermoplasmatota archaeon]|nr:VCBS repeat-containing protein [Candidatus Thermoplasmatota archaeon]
MRASRASALLLALLLVVPLALGGTSLLTDINNSTANEVHPFRNFDAPTSAVADFDKDGIPEIVAHNDNQYVYVLATKSPRVLAEFRPDYPSGWNVRPINDPAVADVDGDGRLDIVVVNSAGRVCVYEYQSGTSTTSMSFARQWCRTMDLYDSPGADAGAAVADVNGDGKMEIFSQVEKKGLYAYNWDGSLRWSKNEWGGNAGPLVSDLDGDGRLEVIFFSDGGTVKAYDASSGSSKWTFYAGSYVKPASITLAGNAADIDGDGKKEVVFGARDAPAGDTYYGDNHLMIFVLSHTGSLQKRWQPSWANPLTYTHPVLVDVDGDGVRDILMQDWNTIGHKPGNWEKLGPANVFAYKHDGTLLWRTVLDNSWSNDDLAVADVDGDGKQEVLAIGYNSAGMDGIWYLDLRTGAKEAHVGVGSGWQALRGPIAGNLDGSGRTSWAVSVDKSGSSEGGFKIFRTDATCNVAFGGWQNAFGCGKGGSTPPPPSGEFDATFSSPGGNEWWVEITVRANQPLARVDASIDGGSWRPLELKSWGDWAASYHAPDGSIVRFRATSTGGATDLSGCYRWTSGTSVECGDGGGTTPPPPTGDVTFTHGGGNEWWVEVAVSPKPGAVQAMDTNGAWVTLELKSWGEWAGSFRIEPGHQVRFRANVGGSWTESCWFSHPQGVSQCGSAPPPSGTFSATFKNVRGNEWWVETDVSASGGTLVGVDARVNGGSWTALEKKSWGSWAQSIHAPAGSVVEFRARASDGQTAVSGKYTWPPK